ncbi:uncharacterized protein LOC125441789 isoform X2 [Sphaerodactylus townsendi]|uniref:uncharacterized protein LOC125441789 isoform X2 n=1 Tax=Sphaerodactylus townsendi TaxID=933632 RepID=UPI0020267DA1|nr:uncharacterized protein LOC125441789 isoform X2 [Sphaerodactylus townsendi]
MGRGAGKTSSFPNVSSACTEMACKVPKIVGCLSVPHSLSLGQKMFVGRAVQALNLCNCSGPLQLAVTSATQHKGPCCWCGSCVHVGKDAGKCLRCCLLTSPSLPPVQLSRGLFHEEPLPYLVHQPPPWQVQYVTQSRRTSRDGEGTAVQHPAVSVRSGRTR